MSHDAATLAEPLELPCGAVMRNRLVKAPLEEMLSHVLGGPPTPELLRLYSTWAEGGWGMIITGNINVDERYLGLPFDVVCPPPEATERRAHYAPKFAEFARAIKGGDSGKPGALAVAQLVHCGRQTMRGMGRLPWSKSQAPSALPLRPSEALGGVGTVLDAAMFGTPQAMSVETVHEVVARFVSAAQFCARNGFDGVELHAAHGYLLSTFLSPEANQRTDAYGGDAVRRFRIVREIIEGVRAAVPASFIVGIKLNSGDYVRGGLTEEDALQNVAWLAEMRMVDFVEVSGGNYENPVFFRQDATPVSERTRRREGFFIEFAHRCRTVVPKDSHMAIIVTGGFQTRTGMAQAVRHGGADGIVLGRAACQSPALPRKLTNPTVSDAEACAPAWPVKVPSWLPDIPLAGGGWNSLWHDAQLHRIAHGQEPASDVSLLKFVAGIVWQSTCSAVPRLLDR